MSRIVAVAFALVVSAACAEKNDVTPFTGAFEGGGVAVELREGTAGELQGTLELAGTSYPIKGRVTKSQLVGTFTSDGNFFQFTMTRRGDGLTLESAGASYDLVRASQGANPLAKASPEKAPADTQPSGEATAVHPADSEPTPPSANGETGEASASKASATPPAASATPPAASAPTPKPTGLAGTYSGSIAGTASVLKLSTSAGNVNGSIDAGGYIYKLQGQAEGNSASGTLQDASTGAQLPFQANVSGNQLTFSFAGNSVLFTRGGGNAAGSSAGGRAPQQTDSEGQRNPALVGVWSRTDSMSSGGFSMSTQYFMRVNANGTFETGTGRSAGGGAGIGFGSGDGVEITGRGRWKTVGNIVHVSEGGGFTPYARYYVEGSKLMFTFGNGNREIWYRN